MIDIENATDSVIEISFNKPYGINGRDPCPNDFVEVFDGVENNSPSLGRHCFLRRPDAILTSSSAAKVVFQGSSLSRPASRVGVSITYETIQKGMIKNSCEIVNYVCFIIFVAVNECKIDNGGCAHMCYDSVFAYSCHCHEGFILDSDRHNCIGKTFIWKTIQRRF